MILQEWEPHDPTLDPVGLKRYRIKVSGDKVYLNELTMEEEWQLLYDFSIMPGEFKEVVTPRLPKCIWYDSVYCISKQSGEEDGLTRVDLVETRFKDATTWEPTHGHWILGLGNEKGIFTQSAYNYSGYYPMIMRNVTLNGNLIYAGVMSSINNTDDNSAMLQQYYDMMGSRRQNVDEPGIYVRVRGNKAEKIIVK